MFHFRVRRRIHALLKEIKQSTGLSIVDIVYLSLNKLKERKDCEEIYRREREKKSSWTGIRANERSNDLLEKMSDESGLSKSRVLSLALEEFQKDKDLEALNQDYSALMDCEKGID